MLEENLAYVEKGEMAVTFASGMGAISGALGVLLKSMTK
jgi:cystathionine beta-lyase/cystathionine gamma-synthase